MGFRVQAQGLCLLGVGFAVRDLGLGAYRVLGPKALLTGLRDLAYMFKA